MDAPFISVDASRNGPARESATPSPERGSPRLAVGADAAPLAEANRHVLEAIETPPDTGIERELDGIAATLWTLKHDVHADQGACCRVREKLQRLERRVDDRRSVHIERARRAVDSYLKTLDAV